ncbi:MAG: TadE/TadG family type IV pilus assembly protein [Pseudomonadota bacterium]|nr:TadE/TadG family type IV pilus assembly protein [Pseudomonadota bacterium]
MRRSLIRRLARDETGVSAVEFALIAPVMILFYAGMVDLCQGYMAVRRTSHVAASVADLTAQSRDITKADIDNVFLVGPSIMAPFAPASLEQRVSSVSRDTTTKYTVNWSRSWAASGGSGALSGRLTVADADIPADLLPVGSSIIIAEARYTYASPFQRFLPSASFTRRAYLNPREVTQIACTDC